MPEWGLPGAIGPGSAHHSKGGLLGLHESLGLRQEGLRPESADETTPPAPAAAADTCGRGS